MERLRYFGTLVVALLLLNGCSFGQGADRSVVEPSARPTDAPSATAVSMAPTVTGIPGQLAEQPTVLPEATPGKEVVPSLGFSDLSPAMAKIVASLQGLSLGDFYEESYKQLLLRTPQRVIRMGLADEFGVQHDQLDDLSDGYIRETQELEEAVLGLLRTYDRAGLDPEQQVSYDVYEWYLDDLVRSHEFMYYDYPVHHFLGSYDDRLVRFFTELHPLDDRQDAKDYVSRLSQVDDQVGQLLEGLELREQAGIVPPGFVIDMALANLRSLASGATRVSPFYMAFSDRIGSLDGIADTEVQRLLESAEQEIAASVQPAFATLVDYFEGLRSSAPMHAGLWQFPEGDAYYAYLLRNQTSTDLTPDEIHELGLAEVARIQAEIRALFDELGYPKDGELGELMDRAIEEGGYYDIRTQDGKDRLLEAYDALLADAEQRLLEAMDIFPQAKVIVVGDTSHGGGGYYVSASPDGSRPGAFHTGIGGSWVPKFNMPTIAYHEAIPGHHFQIALAQEQDLPLFRTDILYNGYAEGWALYAERLAWELDLYQDDPYGNLGRLQLELLRAVRLVTDTGIHARQWSRQQAKAYMNEALGDPSGRWSHEVDRYTVRPAQALGYKIGMLKILELRQRAMGELGDQFDLKDFHHVVLSNGSVPLEILDRLVQASIDARSGGAGPETTGDGTVRGWAVLAEKDDYSDVDMTDLPVDYTGVTQMRGALERSGWQPDSIHELREFDRESLQQYLDWLAGIADEDDIVLLYVAAHGSYLRDVLAWDHFFAADWQQIPSERRLLVIDSCQAANYTAAISGDPRPFLSIAAVAGDEYAWSGLEEEGLPIIGGVFTHYFAAALGDPTADADGDGHVSAQEAALLAEVQQRTYMHDTVFAVPEFVEMYHEIGTYPEKDPTFPSVVVEDTLDEPLYLDLAAYP